MNEILPISLPKVSIVTPAYNQAKYLEETMLSVLNQSYPQIEYIVIDDGSKDNTLEIALEIAERYPGRVIVHHQTNIGQASTLNKGWGLSTGKYIGYLSSDDILEKSAVSKMVAHLESDINTVCTYPNASLIDENSRIIKKNICKDFIIEELVIFQECHIGPGALFRKDAFLKVGGWDTQLRLAPDREYWIRLHSIGKIQMINELLAGYRIHENSISYKDVSEEISREYLTVLDTLFKSKELPQNIINRKNEAYGYAYLLIARNCFRAWRISRGLKLYKEAYKLHPKLKHIKFKLQILKNILSKPIRITLAKLFNAL